MYPTKCADRSAAETNVEKGDVLSHGAGCLVPVDVAAVSMGGEQASVPRRHVLVIKMALGGSEALPVPSR